MNYIETILAVRWYYILLSINCKREYKVSRKHYLKSHCLAKCWLCDEPMAEEDKSIDHVIPLNLIKEYQLYKLLFDHRNFKMAHRSCNTNRGELTLEDLPVEYQQAIKRLTNEQ